MTKNFAGRLILIVLFCSGDLLAQAPETIPLRVARDMMNIDAVRREFVYALVEDKELALDIYYPRTKKPAGGFPVIVWFHGGGWIMGSKRQDVFVRDFPKYDFAVVSVQYRLALGATFPAQVHDARTACHWLWKNAAELGLDPDRMVLTGQSAGGHLALLTAYSEGRNPPGWGPALPKGTVKAVAAMYPPTDLLRLVPADAIDNALHPVALLLGGDVRSRVQQAREASPLNQARSGAPPTLLLHGLDDGIVPVEQSRILARRLRSLGVPVTLITPKGGHAFALFPDNALDAIKFLETVPSTKHIANSQALTANLSQLPPGNKTSKPSFKR